MDTRTMMWTAAAAAIVVGSVGCDNGSTTSASTTPPAPMATNSPVTNTNATIERPAPADPLASVINRDRIVVDRNATKIDPPKAATLVTGFSTMVRESPRGAKMETIETTANVDEIQRDGDYYLITYPDPKGGKGSYAGWVYKDSLDSGQWASQGAGETNSKTVALSNAKPGAAKLSCASGQSHLRTTNDFCAATCKDDSGCNASGGQVCDGLAFKVDERSNKTSNVRYCVTSTPQMAVGSHGMEHGALPR